MNQYATTTMREYIARLIAQKQNDGEILYEVMQAYEHATEAQVVTIIRAIRGR